MSPLSAAGTWPPEPATVGSNHVTLGGYTHSILRPFDSVYKPRDIQYGSHTKKCDWPLFAPNGHQKWCNQEDAVNYYAMRPIVSPDTYSDWLVEMFNYLVTPDHEVSKLLDQELIPNMFCMAQEEVMRWLMQRVEEAVHKLPQMQNNGSWKFEQFYATDVQFYSFGTQNGYSIYKIIFNLYNTLRSVSTLVDCVIMDKEGQRKLLRMGVVTQDHREWQMDGQNLGSPKYGVGIDSGLRNYGFEWDYGNTLESQKFNEVGTFDPHHNISIEGGIPESLRGAIQACQGGSILPIPQTIGLTGVSANGSIVRNTGQPQWVRADMGVTYSSDGAKKVYY